MRYCAALCNCRYIHTLWCLATDLMCFSFQVFISCSLLAGCYWGFHRGKSVPFANRAPSWIFEARVTFLSTTARPAPPRRLLSNMAATKKRTPGFLAEEKLQRLQVGYISCTISQKGIVLPAPLFLTFCVMCYTYERADFMSRLSPKQWARM